MNNKLGIMNGEWKQSPGNAGHHTLAFSLTYCLNTTIAKAKYDNTMEEL
ncbi:MAG: hypothetical protein GY765_04150 [bacterium]|nr:hypothetical protein [bacterium]